MPEFFERLKAALADRYAIERELGPPRPPALPGAAGEVRVGVGRGDVRGDSAH